MSFSQFVDDIPKPAMIFMMVLGFVAFWPIGLAILGYMYWSGKMGKCGRSGVKHWSFGAKNTRSSGNHAFDEYRDETLRRLEDEQKEFEMFLERLKMAKDQKEFDQFMTERNKPDVAQV